MSSLLQNVLASRLAQATLGTSDTQPPENTLDVSGASGSSTVHTNPNDNTDPEDFSDGVDATSDEELVGVVSLPGTVPGTPHISRPSSPGLQVKPSSTKRSGLSRQHGATSPRRSKTDPLRAFPKEVSQRIFLRLPVSSLISLSQVNKRYRRSATLNYCWYRYCTSETLQDLADPFGPSGAKWTRRASKTDWKKRYARMKRMEAREAQRLDSVPGSGAATPSRSQRLRDEGIVTPSEMRQEEWAQQDDTTFTKDEMREWYKSQGGSKGGKLKGKRGKGGAKTGADDGSLWQ